MGKNVWSIWVMIAGVLLSLILVTGSRADEEGKKIDREYIRKHYPEVYEQIFREGKDAGLRERDAQVQTTQKEPESPPSSDGAPKKETAPHDKAGPGDWWNRSSLSQPDPERFLFHAEGAFTGMWLEGNNMGHSYKGTGGVTLRRGRFTNTLSYNIAKTKIDQTDGGSTNRNYQLAEEALQFDLTKTFFTQAGVLWEKDSVNYIGDRMIYYVGAGAYVLNSDRFKLKVVGAYGQEHERYNIIVTELIGLREKNTGVFYGYQSFDWQITKRFSFQEGFRILWDLKDSPLYKANLEGGYVNTGEKQSFRTLLHLELDYKITPHFSLLLSSDTRFESVPWPGVKQRDITNTVGVKFSY